MGGEQSEGKKRRRSRKRSKTSGAAEDDEPASGGDPNVIETTNNVEKAESDDDGDDNDDGSTNDDRQQQHENHNKDSEVQEEDAGNDEDDEEGEEKKKRKRKRNRKKKSDTTDAENGNEPSSNEADAAKLSSVEHTVFIEGLPFTSTEEEIRGFFTNLGCNDILQLRLPVWQDSGRLRGFGHVVFASQETRTRALSNEVNGKELGGRYITVREANAPRAGTTIGAALGGRPVREQPKGCKTVFVRNLPYTATEEQILESFRVCGKILDGGVRIARNHSNGQSKGFGYVEYKNEEGALAAVQKAAKPFGLQVQGRPVFVDYDEGAMKNSFRGGDGKLWTKEHGDLKSSASTGGGRGGGMQGGRGMGMRGRGRY
jgi:nucleolin